MEQQLNVFGEPLIACSNNPVTGYFRDGCCNTDETDFGVHTVCVIVTDEFLKFSIESGNDLTTPHPNWGFPGLQAGDKWCLCASRFLDAHERGFAPKVVLEATNEKTLEVVPMDVLIKHAYYSKQEI
ncbi:MAG: DUF2237 domain-containing protein [Flavobacteriales bacterium]|nr:DUF2237 domain-containing protein [Flavobacteriales bacterium]MCB9173972.1 DUF2237 domain-containing protein [Flavobacteriales bacterium]